MIGFEDEDLIKLNVVVWYVVIVWVGNMLLGVNLLIKLMKKVVEVLDEDFDIEIVEVYYNKKVDVLLGIVLMLGEVVVEGCGVLFVDVCDSGCDGIMGVCIKGDIGFVVICGGDVVGEYDVIFVVVGEWIVLCYLVMDWVIFVWGVFKVVFWG